MDGYFELTPFYEGQAFSVYLFDSRKVGFPEPELSEKERREPRLGKLKLRKLGYRLWSPDRSYVPTHQVRWGSGVVDYYNLKGALPPADVCYSRDTKASQWVVTDSACKSRFIPKVFNLSIGGWAVEKDLLYRTSALAGAFSLENITPEELAWLESAGVQGLTFGLCRDRVYCQLEGGVPTAFCLQKMKHISYPEVKPNLLEVCERSIPLWTDPKELQDYVYFEADGVYWRMGRKRKKYSAIEAIALFGINQPMEVQCSTPPQGKVHTLPLDEVSAVGPDDVLYCYPDAGDLVTTIPRFDKPQGDVSLGYKELYLKKGYYHFTKHKVVLVSSSTTQEDLEAYGLRRLRFNESAGGKRVRVARVQEGKVCYLHGYYAFVEDIRKHRLRQTFADYQSLKLKHTPPPPLTEWWIEDLEKYNQLVESGEFHPEMCVRVGDRILPVPSHYRSGKLFQTNIRFVTKDERRDAYLWQVLTWEEFIARANSLPAPTKEKVLATLFDAMVVGVLSRDQVVDWLARQKESN